MQLESIKPVPSISPTLTVHVVTGEHTHPIPPGLGDLVHDALAARNVVGQFKLRMGPFVQGTNSMHRLKVVRVTARNTIELRCKPGGNDSVRVCWLSQEGGDVTVGGKLDDGPLERSLLLAALSQPVKGDSNMAEAHSAGAKFTHDSGNLRAVQKVLCASGAGGKYILAERARKVLMESGVGPAGMTRASWGQVLGVMGRKGMLDIKRGADPSAGIVAVRVPEQHVPKGMGSNGAAKLPAAVVQPVNILRGHMPTSVPPLPSSVSAASLQQWAERAADIEEALLGQLVVAEEEERQASVALDKARAHVELLRTQMGNASKTLEAAKLLLGLMTESGGG